jgi:hypothetical protein
MVRKVNFFLIWKIDTQKIVNFKGFFSYYNFTGKNENFQLFFALKMYQPKNYDSQS